MGKHRWGQTMRGGALSLTATCTLLTGGEGDTSLQRVLKAEEYEARAAFLHSLGKFTEWPEGSLPPGEPFVIGVLGETPMAGVLEGLALPPLQGRKVVVRRFRSVADVQPCAILYFPAAEERHLRTLEPKLAGHGVLTVGETSFFLGFGGMLHLFNEEGKLRFVLNRTALDQSKLRISAQVQKLAKQIVQNP